MAIHVLIADDEFFIRQRLKKIIPWEELGLTFAGEAQDGQEVLRLLKEQPIDILILDIKMPRMDGICAANLIHQNYPEVHTVILSGYNDFEYARQALHYGVRDYLLKPVEETLLISTLKTCIASVRDAKKQHRQMRLYYHAQLCTLLHHVLYGSAGKEELYSRYPHLKDMELTLFLQMYDGNAIDETVLELARSLRGLGYACEYCHHSEYICTLQLFFLKAQDLSLFKAHLDNLAATAPPARFLCVGQPIPMGENWLPAYKRVRQGLGMRYFESSPLLLPETMAELKQNYAPELSKIRHKITLCLNNRNERELTEEIQRLFTRIKDKKDAEYLHMVLLELFLSFHISHQLPGTTSAGITGQVAALLDEEYRLFELFQTAVSYGRQCIPYNTSQPSDVALSHKLMQYIHTHYTEPDLSIAKIAGEFSLNPSYMGTAFKKANNISILQYMANVRLEAALMLLKENRYKISEVAEMVGYSDVFYFSKRFKNAYGCPPKDYASYL